MCIRDSAGSSTGTLLVHKEEDIEKVFKYTSKVVAVHSEDEDILNQRKKLRVKGDVKSHPVWRNEECAMSSTRRIVKIAIRLNKKAHILHITTKEEVDFLSKHKGNITFEITPQHLTIYAPDCYEELGSFAQMNPPIRDKSHYDRLWYAIKNNYNDTIGSDHAPHLAENKRKEYPDSPSGMPGVQTLLPVMLNHINDGKLKLEQLIKLVCEYPVKIFGIQNKGFIKKKPHKARALELTNIKNNSISSDKTDLPFLGRIAAGNPIEAITGSFEQISVPNYLIDNNDEHFTLEVNGDSMIDYFIADGHMVLMEHVNDDYYLRNETFVSAQILRDLNLVCYNCILYNKYG